MNGYGRYKSVLQGHQTALYEGNVDFLRFACARVYHHEYTYNCKLNSYPLADTLTSPPAYYPLWTDTLTAPCRCSFDVREPSVKPSAFSFVQHWLARLQRLFQWIIVWGCFIQMYRWSGGWHYFIFSLYYWFHEYIGSRKTLYTHSALTWLRYIICRGSVFVGPVTIRNTCTCVLACMYRTDTDILILVADSSWRQPSSHDKPSHVDLDLLHTILVCSYFVKKGLCQEFCSMDSELTAPTSRLRHRPQVRGAHHHYPCGGWIAYLVLRKMGWGVGVGVGV